jgi:hypothetical protein
LAIKQSDITIGSEEQRFKVVAYATLYIPFAADSLNIALLDLKKEEMMPEGGYIFLSSWFNFYIAETFITNHFQTKSADYLKFIEQLKSFYPFFSNLYNETDAESHRYSMFSFFYITMDQEIFHFQLSNNTSEGLLLRTEKIFEAMNSICLKTDMALNESLADVFTQHNKSSTLGT